MIYILLLENDKFYVGYTEREDGERFKEHFTGNGSEWTKKYRPVQVLEWRKGSLEDENIVTIEYMKKYGWWNVRGGDWCSVDMSKPPKQLIPKLPSIIEKDISMENIDNNGNNEEITQLNINVHNQTCKRTMYGIIDQLYNTKMNTSHKQLIKSCLLGKQKPMTEALQIGEIQKQNTERNKKSNLNIVQCYKCKKIGHYANICKVKTKTKIISTCYKCGKKGHFANKCTI